jgi:acyl transferase domain-containing protein
MVVQSHEAYLRAHPENLEDLSYTLNVRREPLPYRAYSVVSRSSIMQPLKVSTFERSNGKYQLVYVFTGQGVQWARMGASLLEGNPIFQRTIQRLELELSKCKPAPSWSLTSKSSLCDIKLSS